MSAESAIVPLLQSHNRPVCMDGRMLLAGTGVATYARLLRAAQSRIVDRPLVLGELGCSHDRSRLLRLIAALPRGARAAAVCAGRDDRFVYADLFRTAQIHFNIYRRLLAVDLPGPPGIMHWTYPVPLRVNGWANLYTVHDAIPLCHPALTPIDPVRHRRLLERISERASALVTVSRSARTDIIAALGCPADFVVDCSQAVDVSTGPVVASLPKGLAAGRYLLVCGSVEPRKNIGRIIQAHAESGSALPLVLAGPDGWHAGDLGPAMQSPGVIRVPYLDRETMLATIAQARALLMPSLAEGFGLPVAEAMALGTPVLTTRTGALAETAGDAAILVDPLDVGDIARGIRQLAEDDVLCANLAAAGRVRAGRFALPRFAEALATLYGKFIAPPVS